MSNETNSKTDPATAGEERPKIKVTDRRMFDTDGNPRETAEDQPEATGTDAPPQESSGSDEAPEPAPHPDAPSPAADTTPDRGSEPTLGAEGESPAAESMADFPRDFSAFVESQFLEALIFLGAMPHPQSGETTEDPEIARYKIDLLTMIQEKTAGNLTPDEDRLLEDVLYQLRMLFVEKTKPGIR